MGHLHIVRMYSLAIMAHVVSGQTGPASTTVVNGTMAQLVCRNDGTPAVYAWRDITRYQNVFVGASKSNDPRYRNFAVSDPAVTTSSALTISDIDIEDEGQYRCTLGANDVTPDATVTVEVRSTLTLNVASPLTAGVPYAAQCDAVGGRPRETITWYINDVQQTSGVEETNPSNPNPDLSNTRSVLTFTPTEAYNGQTLSCRITGHQLDDLNQKENSLFNVRYPPGADKITLQIDYCDPTRSVIMCNINSGDQPNPAIDTYTITVNGTIISSSPYSLATLTVAPQSCTEITCTGSNGLGDTSSTEIYCPRTIPATTTVLTSSEATMESPAPCCACNISNGLSTPIVAGIAVLALLLALSVIINIIFIIMWKRSFRPQSGSKSKKKTDNSVDEMKTGNNEAYEMFPGVEEGYMALKPEGNIFKQPQSAEIPLENISLFTRLGAIGTGAFGQMWKGEVRAMSGTKHVSTPAAIRQLPGNISDSSNLVQVVSLLWKLENHLNVVKCFGCCLDQTSIQYEYISNGSLLTYLQTNGGLSHTTYANVKPMTRRIDEDKLLRFAWQIAKGMDVLSSNKLIHGRLCVHNVLLTEDKQCKISDYGLSTIMPTENASSRWMSPEAMIHGACSVQSDVWSFGIVLWEIVTLGIQPYPGMSLDVMKERVCNGYRMPRPKHCDKELYDIMANCWQEDARKRCQFKQLLSKLEHIMERSHDYLSLSNLDERLYASTSPS